jgi:transcriptional regulator with XRE-family HTH domain
MLAMSQEKLGAALKLTFQQVQKYEKGANRIGASRLQQISDILQNTSSVLLPGRLNESAPHGSNELSMADSPGQEGRNRCRGGDGEPEKHPNVSKASGW